MAEVWWLLGMCSFASVVSFRLRRRRAEQEVGRLIDRAGLPTDRVLVAGAAQHFVRRHGALAIGAWGGGVAGVVPYALLGATPTALAWFAACTLVGTGVGACLLHLRTLRSARAPGPRVASLRPRRLSDFLTPAELAVQYGMLTLPLVTAVLGVYALTGGDHPRRGWALLAAATTAVLVMAGATALQRWILRANQPAGEEAALRWEEALRAAMLRDVSAVAVGSSWALGGLTGFSAVTGWAEQFAGPWTSVAVGLYLIGTLAVVWTTLVGTYSRRTLGRFQQVIG